MHDGGKARGLEFLGYMPGTPDEGNGGVAFLPLQMIESETIERPDAFQIFRKIPADVASSFWAAASALTVSMMSLPPGLSNAAQSRKSCRVSHSWL